MADPIPCIHSDGGRCYLRKCLSRGCKKALDKGLTLGTGKLAGDRLCPREVGGFCEYIHPCEFVCKKIEAMERARGTAQIDDHFNLRMDEPVQ